MPAPYEQRRRQYDSDIVEAVTVGGRLFYFLWIWLPGVGKDVRGSYSAKTVPRDLKSPRSLAAPLKHKYRPRYIIITATTIPSDRKLTMLIVR